MSDAELDTYLEGAGIERDPMQKDKLNAALATSFDLCIDILGKYPPIPPKKTQE